MNIGFIGLGIMGESMAENIVKKHDGKVFVFDFVQKQVDKLAGIGAVACENSVEVAKHADIIISMVPKSEHSRSVYNEILNELDESKLCIDMSTIDPHVSVEVSELVKKTGAQFIDAPVVKSKPAAVSGTLGIYVGGDKEAYVKAEEILGYMGNNIIHMGKNGMGLVMKVCHNTLVAQIQNGVNETLALAEKYGISIDDYVTAISYGGGQNFYLDGKAKAIKDENYTTAFSVDNMEKDLGICFNMAQNQNIEMPGAVNALGVYKEAQEKKYGKEDFSATIKVVRERMK